MGQRWAGGELDPEDLDPQLLMWDVRRRMDPAGLPSGDGGRRVVVEVRFSDLPGDVSRYWLVLRPDEVELCLKDPGHEVELWLTTELPILTAVWMGDLSFEAAVADGRIDLQGPASLRRRFPRWLGRGLFAGVERPSRAELETAPA